MTNAFEEILGPGGLLDEALERYEYRPQQVEMATGVARALKERHPLIVEAATGTGKTLAYLIPAIMSGRRVVISTGTKALQEQLFFKDVPFLQTHLGKSFKAVLLKGRRNYLCKYRMEEMLQKPNFRSAKDFDLWPRIQRWAKKTETGDRAEVDGMPDNYPTWAELSVGSDACLGSKCSFWEDCYVQQARRNAQEADVIVVNHHLFFADLALRQGGHGEILPEYDAVIFDEAHHLEDVATEYFGLEVSNYRFRELSGDVDRALDDEEVNSSTAGLVTNASVKVDSAAESLFDTLREVLGNGRQALSSVLQGEVEELIDTKRKKVDDELNGLSAAIRKASMGEVGQRLAERCQEIAFELKSVMGGADSRFAYVAEQRDRGVFLQAAPIDLASELRTRLLETHDALIFTSATLATGGDFSYFKRRMGMAESSKEDKKKRKALAVEELLLPPVFNYEEQCLIYIPRKLPAPNDPKFCENVALIVKYLVDITEGRAFVLFTSYQNMRDVHGRLAEELEYPVFLQGELSKRELLDKFRETEHAVLFATASFWEGVDVEGESLSLVIIDKLPFANPSDPLTRARLDLLEEQGGSSFQDISLPTAAISLRQGFGRLIRSGEDTGVVAILDSRIAHKSYGRYFLKSLPPAPVVWTAPEVKRWWLNK